MRELSVEVLRPEALSAHDEAAWTAFAAESGLDSPFLGIDYARRAGSVAPRAQVARARRAGRTVAFLPFQSRGLSTLQPLGAPLTDYHGLIAEPGTDVDVAAVLRALGGRRFRATAWLGDAAEGSMTPRRRMVADISDGVEAWSRAHASMVKDKARRRRALARDCGEPVFAVHDPDPAALEWLIASKRAQYRRTRQHDVFACGWTERLLRVLLAERTAGSGGALSTLRVGGRLVAAEYALRGGGVHHLWFPAYDPDYAKYSPGALLLLEVLKQSASDGIGRLDFGADLEGYKSDFATAAETVLEGELKAASRLRAPRIDMLREVRRKARRRFEVIRGCEVAWTRQALASLESLASMTIGRLTGVVGGTFGAVEALQPALALA